MSIKYLWRDLVRIGRHTCAQDVKSDIINCEDDYMPLALVLINTEIGSEGELLETLRKMDVVEEAYMLYGVYDIVAKVNANSMEQLKDIIKWNIRLLDKVRSTTTMMVVDETK